jgi:predicted TIM-barrel fold metal-dependent hydrolase
MMQPPTRRSRLIHAAFAAGAAALLAGCATGRSAPLPPPATGPGAIPKIDFHAHYWQPHPELGPTLDRWAMRAVLVNVNSEGELGEKWRGMRALDAQQPGRFILTTTFDPAGVAEPGFAERTIDQLGTDIAQGARMVKVWKDVGLELKDRDGSYVQIDDARFQPIWDFLAERGVPVLAHIAEPRAAWLPLDPRDPHYNYYRGHPQYHAYQHPEMPRWETIIAARDRWLARNPRLVVVGAHMGSMSHDVREVARRLDDFPNLHVEMAARVNDLAMQPGDRVRDFLLRYQDRVLFGTDASNGSAQSGSMDALFSRYWDYLSRPDSFFIGSRTGWGMDTQGLGLPREVLEKIYRRNAERILGLEREGQPRAGR